MTEAGLGFDLYNESNDEAQLFMGLLMIGVILSVFSVAVRILVYRRDES